jgi:hypothetical protein
MPPKQKAKGKPAGTKAESAKVTESAPHWPPLQPLIAASDLRLEVLVPTQILLIRKFWTSTLCKRYVQFLSNLPLTTTPGKPKKGEAVRVNDRFQVEDPDFATTLWNQTAICSLVQQSAGIEHGAALWGGTVVSQTR